MHQTWRILIISQTEGVSMRMVGKSILHLDVQVVNIAKPMLRPTNGRPWSQPKL